MKKVSRAALCAKLSRCVAAVTGAVCAVLMTAVSYYSGTLPDSFVSEYGTHLEIDTAVPITAVELRRSRAVYNEENTLSGRELTLKLFGSVPIKEVREDEVKRPMLAAGGQAFGIRLVTDGVMIIDLKKINGRCPAKESGLRIGDVIETLNGERVASNARVSEIIRASGGEECSIEYRRGEKRASCTLYPVYSEGSYRAGMWVRDSSAGIGTVSFIDPAAGVFAGLGHAICDADTHEPLPLSKGSVSEVTISGCKKSRKGEPGQLMGEFVGEETGELLKNCGGGVYGVLYDIPDPQTLYPLGFAHEVHEGEATMIAQIDEGKPQSFSIEIEKLSGAESGHDMIIKVTDEELISKTGGIVQGMSGSPIIQDGRLVGAVTHVFVDDPLGGYGIFAQTMYEYALGISDNSEERAS